MVLAGGLPLQPRRPSQPERSRRPSGGPTLAQLHRALPTEDDLGEDWIGFDSDDTGSVIATMMFEGEKPDACVCELGRQQEQKLSTVFPRPACSLTRTDSHPIAVH